MQINKPKSKYDSAMMVNIPKSSVSPVTQVQGVSVMDEREEVKLI